MNFKDFERIVRQANCWPPTPGSAWAARPNISPSQIRSKNRRVCVAAATRIAVRVLGGGSNLLVRDEGVSGMVLRKSRQRLTTSA